MVNRTTSIFWLSAETTADERVSVLICCEMISNYCDNVALQRENIPDEVWQRWRTFIKEQVTASVELHRFMRQYLDWYSPALAVIQRTGREKRRPRPSPQRMVFPNRRPSSTRAWTP